MTQRDEIIWLAGLLEGEGTFRARQNPRYPRSRPVLRIKLNMTDQDVVARAAAIMGTTVSPYVTPRGYSQQYVTEAYGYKGENVMRSIRPYMGKRRGEKIDSILSQNLSHQPRP